MDCLFCSSQLVSHEESFFYLKGEKDVSLAIKPEFEATVLEKKTISIVTESKTIIRVKCGTCNSNVGRIVPFGPGGTKFHAFGMDKVKLNGRTLKKTQKWWNTRMEFPMIETRDPNNFFNVLKHKINTDVVVKEKEPMTNIIFPSLNDLTDFEWYSVSLAKKPKIYQIEAFIESLQRNLIVVIKTGAGKTLIASMFLARMCSLNPNKMGVMIVDRIPLVFQQGDAIVSDTNLRVARVCGENKTAYQMKKLNDGSYEILVVTAGAFAEMVARKQIDIDLFCAVVFDECHHVTGGHKYVDCLKLFTKKALLQQPRILGLSASLFHAESVSQAENRLIKYMANFPNAKIYHPSLDKSDTTIKKQLVVITCVQKSFIREIVGKVNNIIQWICQTAMISKSEMELQIDLSNAYHVKGDMRALEGEYPSIPNFNQQIKTCLILIDATEMCETLGIPTACKLLEDNNILNEISHRYSTETSSSSRLELLKRLLATTKIDSKILIFVSTRNVARELFNILEVEFPKFNMAKVFGHGGYDGMVWEGEQECTLQEFRSGICNLLICTSVLEEGLDVYVCDLVICFSGIRSLIQFIQTRGRARKENSHFFVFETENESLRNQCIEAKEEMLSSVLKRNQQAYCYFSELSKDIIKKIEQQVTMGEGSIPLDQVLPLNNADNRPKEFTFNAYVDTIDGVDISKIKVKLLDTLEEYQDFRVNRLEVVTSDVDSVFLSSKDVTTFLVGAVCRMEMSEQNTYLMFCRCFDFQINFENLILNVWTRHNVHVSEKLDSVNSIECTKFGVGFLQSRTSAVVSKIFEQQSTIVFTPRKYIELNFDIEILGDFFSRILVIPLASLGEFALLSTHIKSFVLIIPLKYSPMLYRVDDDGKKVRILDNVEVLPYFANMPVLYLWFNSNQITKIKQILFSKTLFPVDTFDVNMKFNLEYNSSDDPNIQSGFDYILYSIKCLEDSRQVCFPDGFAGAVINHVKEMKDIDLIQLIVEKLYDVAIRSYYFLDVYATFNGIFKEYTSFPASMRGILHSPIPENHFLVKRVLVTPSRTIVLPVVPVASNRLLRVLRLHENKEGTIYDVIILSFRDEDMTKLMEPSLYNRVHQTITNGIFINGVKYRFLLSSGSQLRAHKAYFVSAGSYEEVLHIRHLIIPDPTHFNSSAQYLSRLGQYGTADKFVRKISKDSICWIDDINAMNGDLTTDGAGKISMTLADEIANQLSIQTPSAIQVRYSGIKGMLVCCPDNDPDFHGKQLCFRKSMEKFMNNDEDLCVVSVSKIFDITLNREVITLLSAIKSGWFLNNTLMNYQEHALTAFANIFMDGGSARDALKNYLPKYVIEKLKSHHVDIIEEKYWFKILQGIYRLKVHLLKTKTNIPIEKGCTLIGVPDPIGVLEEDEVFVQLRHNENDIKILETPALIYRNPCLHPGDQRRVNCVNKQELGYLYDVIVMPVKHCTYSLASACSGGDLDGDKFGIIWDPNLVPSKQFIFPPCSYSSLAQDASAGMSDGINYTIDENDDSGFAKFYVNFMKNDCLGRVAHKHLALCDILDDGARDPLAIEMAKSQSTAVDYPKTGILPSVPKKALKKVEENGFPDFMEKSVSETYFSKKILGKLYRRCASVCYNFELSKDDPNIVMDTRIIVEGNEDYLESAAKTYKSYAYNMETLMVKFDLKVEADVILGYATFGWGQHFLNDIGKACDAITSCYSSIVNKYRVLFFSDVEDEESRMRKASAWYRIVNDPSIKIKYNHILKEKFYSFPWIVYDVLCDILDVQNRQQPSRIKFSIGSSTLELFKKNSTILNKNIVA